MGEFVEIKGSVGDIIGIANGLRSRGEELASTMRTAADDIEGKEGGKVFAPDDFTEGFLKTYHDTTNDSQGRETTVNLAVRESAVDMGTRLSGLGDDVAGAMFAYSGTDLENAGDISEAPQDR